MKKISLVLLSALIAIAVNAQTVDTLTIQSKIFNQTRKIKVVLPAGYGKYSYLHSNKEMQYTVAYLFDSQAESFFNFYKNTISYLTSMGYTHLHPLILVGISSADRQYEFLPKAQTQEGLKSYRKSGGADLLAEHLRDEVMPLINSKYHVSPYNIGIGHSLGATFVTYSMLKYPELFNAGIAISPNFWYDNEQMVHKFDSLANEKTFGHKFFYMAYGHGDQLEEMFRPASKKVGELLVKKNIPGLIWQVKELDVDEHGLTPVEGVFKGLVTWNRNLTLLDNQRDAFLNDKSKPFIDNVKDYFKTASSWSGLKLPMIDDLVDISYGLFYSKHSAESIQVFKWGISLYPDNDNLYDSIAEVELGSGDKAAALKYYTEGLEVVKRRRNELTDNIYNGKIAGFQKNIDRLKN